MNKSKLDILIESEVESLTKQQINWLAKVVQGIYKYEDGVVNVKGSVLIRNLQRCKILPVQFGIITGGFHCNLGELITLKGAPLEIEDSFWCDNNELTNLDYMPKLVNWAIRISGNPFALNDKLFEDIKRIGGKRKIYDFDELMRELRDDIPRQFGILDEKVIEQIWKSYMDILYEK